MVKFGDLKTSPHYQLLANHTVPCKNRVASEYSGNTMIFINILYSNVHQKCSMALTS